MKFCIERYSHCLKENWDKIKKIEIALNTRRGDIHFKREFSIFEPFIREKGWDTTIRELKTV